MTVPVYVLGAISLSTQVYFSDKMRKRAVIIVACCVPVAVGYFVPVCSKNPNVGYAGMFVLVVGKYSRFSVIDRSDSPSRPLPNLYASCDLDHNQPGARHKARHWSAIRIQFGQLVEPHLWSALSEQPGTTIRARKCNLGWSHDCCWVSLCLLLVLAPKTKREEIEVDC